jgi:HPt (histidine-containing phosphotransfer) domain-containing protein
MSNDELQQHLARIGQRFLDRTVEEVRQLDNLLGGLRSGNAGTLREIELMMHKMHGSGTMFGFEGISALAGEIEQLVMDTKPSEQLIATLSERFAQLQEAVRTAVAQRASAK